MVDIAWIRFHVLDVVSYLADWLAFIVPEYVSFGIEDAIARFDIALTLPMDRSRGFFLRRR